MSDMSLEARWPRLRQDSRDWLIANNGDSVSRPVLDDIERVGGPVPSGEWWVGGNGPDGFYLSDAGVDWIEEVANGEVSDSPSGSH
jgi:hypothetical protein